MKKTVRTVEITVEKREKLTVNRSRAESGSCPSCGRESAATATDAAEHAENGNDQIAGWVCRDCLRSAADQ